MHYKNDNICDSSAQLSNSKILHIEPTHGRNVTFNNCDIGGNNQSSEYNNKKHSKKTHSNDCKCIVCDKPLTDEKTTWVTYDNEMCFIIDSIEVQLNSGEISPAEAASLFNKRLTEFLESKPNLLHEVKTFYKHKPESMKDINDARKLKTSLNKKAKQIGATKEDKSLACQAHRHYNFLLNEQKNKSESKEIIEQEKAYSKDFFKFAKETTNGTYGKPRISPSYSNSTANTYYKEKYTSQTHIDTTNLNWFPEVNPPTKDYNLEPYSAKDVSDALKNKSQDSAPGEDKILYGYLTKLPNTHKFLADIFTQIRDSSEAPDVWAKSKIILIPKGEETNTENPSDFRMIALTSNVGKLFHTLESSRAMNYMIMNGYLDPKAQKAYLDGVNGCVEHVQVVQEVITPANLKLCT